MKTSSTISKHWSSGINISQSFRLPISAMVTLSSVGGFYLYRFNSKPLNILFLTAGVFFLASGATLLNQVQELKTDRLMERTSSRPITTGQLSRGMGLIISLALITAGLASLFQTGNRTVPILGLLCLLLYNGIYTWLKPHSTLCLLPGGLCGALPPLMGWLAAGGPPADYRIWLLSAVLFLWQIPHFWFLSAAHCGDFQRAGLPTIFDHIDRNQFKRVAMAWLISFLGGISLLAGFEVVQNAWLQKGLFLLAGAGFCLGMKVVLLYREINSGTYKKLFVQLNILMVTVLFFTLLDRL